MDGKFLIKAIEMKTKKSTSLSRITFQLLKFCKYHFACEIYFLFFFFFFFSFLLSLSIHHLFSSTHKKKHTKTKLLCSILPLTKKNKYRMKKNLLNFVADKFSILLSPLIALRMVADHNL